MQNSRLDVVDLYKKGYSIDYIIDCYYRYKTQHDKPNEKIGNMIIIKKKSITRKAAKEKVYNELFEYIK